MNVGMLWFDNDPKAGLAIKIERAADYFRTKYGRNPTLCYVHPSMLPTGSTPTAEQPANLKAGGLEVRPTRTVLPNHFWIGVNGP
jgi:hypothetical protein